MDTSVRFALPFIMAAQAQKHLTHNEALALLETLVQPVVQSMTTTNVPANPSQAQCWVVGTGASDAFAGRDDQIAAWIGDAWHFHSPQAGWTVVDASDGTAHVYAATGWQPLVDISVQNNLAQVGINATASTSNRLTVASDATLLTSQTADHRLTINKASAGDTASIVFQSGWSGRAEMGLAGEDAFSFKVSADGSAWQTALAITPATGHVSMPGRAVASAYLDGGTRTFAANDVAGFSGLSQAQGGMALGAALTAPATGAPMVVAADGLYQVTLRLNVDTLGAVTLLKNNLHTMVTWDGATTSAGGQTVTFSAVMDMAKGDTLALRFDGAATCYCNAGTTVLDVICL